MPVNPYKHNPLVMLGVPTLQPHPMSWEWADYYAAQFSSNLGTSFVKYRVHDMTIAAARNALVEEALRQNCDYILFLGDDVLAPPNLFDLLHRHREMMVTGVYWTKTYPSFPYLWNGWMHGPYVNWKVGEYFPVDWAGCDALLVNMDVFRAIERPWFSTDWKFVEGRQGPPIGPDTHPVVTEDLYFYTKARQAGFQLYCDTAAQCDHQDRTTMRRFGLTAEMPQAQFDAPPASEDPVLYVADLGCGLDTPWFGQNAQIRRYDADPRVKPDVRCDLRAIPEPDAVFDIVHARHVLEHFPPFEAPALIGEWTRILKVGGELRLNVPNLAYAAREILKAEEDATYYPGAYPHWQLFGRQVGDPGEVHRNGFTRASLADLLRVSGMVDIAVEVEGPNGENLQATARKEKSNDLPALAAYWQELEAGGE